jgi:phage repressor protein C with HTH and peptisase S24 domain
MSLKLIRIHRLKRFQSERNVEGPVELGKLIGRKPNQTSDLLSGRAAFGEKVARSIEEFAALPPGWLDQADDDETDIHSLVRESGIGSSTDVSITALRTSSAKSDSNEDRQDLALKCLTLSSAWIERAIGQLSGANNLRFTEVQDDSMEPTFRVGDLLLVDTGIAEWKRDGIYLLRANGRVYARRVRRRMDGAFEISADSTTVKTADVIVGPLSVLGRVVWAWNGRKL